MEINYFTRNCYASVFLRGAIQMGVVSLRFIEVSWA